MSVGSSPPRAAKPAPSINGCTLRFRVHLSSTSCRGRVPASPALFCASVVPRKRFTLYSAASLSCPLDTGATQCRPADSRVRHELLRPSPPSPQYSVPSQPAGSRLLVLSLSPRRCSRARRVFIGCEPRLGACGCVGLCNAPSGGAVRALSYPETSGFPDASLRPYQPCSAEPVSLFPIHRLLPLAVHTTPVRDLHSLSLMSGPDPLARPAVSSSPSTSADMAGGKSGSNAALQPQAPRAAQ
jgi:hypothetical protein